MQHHCGYEQTSNLRLESDKMSSNESSSSPITHPTHAPINYQPNRPQNHHQQQPQSHHQPPTTKKLFSLSDILNNVVDKVMDTATAAITTTTKLPSSPSTMSSASSVTSSSSSCDSKSAINKLKSTSTTTEATATTSLAAANDLLTVQELFEELQLDCDEHLKHLDKLERDRKTVGIVQKRILDEICLNWFDLKTSKSNNNNNKKKKLDFRRKIKRDKIMKKPATRSKTILGFNKVEKISYHKFGFKLRKTSFRAFKIEFKLFTKKKSSVLSFRFSSFALSYDFRLDELRQYFKNHDELERLVKNRKTRMRSCFRKSALGKGKFICGRRSTNKANSIVEKFNLPQIKIASSHSIDGAHNEGEETTTATTRQNRNSGSNDDSLLSSTSLQTTTNLDDSKLQVNMNSKLDNTSEYSSSSASSAPSPLTSDSSLLYRRKQELTLITDLNSSTKEGRYVINDFC